LLFLFFWVFVFFSFPSFFFLLFCVFFLPFFFWFVCCVFFFFFFFFFFGLFLVPKERQKVGLPPDISKAFSSRVPTCARFFNGILFVGLGPSSQVINLSAGARVFIISPLQDPSVISPGKNRPSLWSKREKSLPVLPFACRWILSQRRSISPFAQKILFRPFFCPYEEAFSFLPDACKRLSYVHRSPAKGVLFFPPLERKSFLPRRKDSPFDGVRSMGRPPLSSFRGWAPFSLRNELHSPYHDGFLLSEDEAVFPFFS